MTAKRKIATPEPATAPVVPPDEAFLVRINVERDGALDVQQKLHSERAIREAHFDTRMAELLTQRDAELKALDLQIRQQGRIIDSCDAAIEQMRHQNVVPISADEQMNGTAQAAA